MMMRMNIDSPEGPLWVATSLPEVYCVLPLLKLLDHGQWNRKDGLQTVRKEPILKHMPIARLIARRIQQRLPPNILGEDLLSAGVVGLIEALEKFDPTKRALFRTFAQCRFRGAILDSLRSLDWGPRRLRKMGQAIEEAIKKLARQFKRPPDDFEIATELNIDLGEYQRLLGSLKDLEIGTLYIERSEDPGEEELVYLPCQPEYDPLCRSLKSEMRLLLGHAIADLPDHERLVTVLRYFEEFTMKQIAVVLGITEPRASQVHAAAILHLRGTLTTALATDR
jgi:RNA polymerase sigma factor for flagellar operon FliA